MLDATCEGDQLEQVCLNHTPCLEFKRYSVTQTNAGDLGTRKFRSGMGVMWGTHLINHGSAVQSTIALSSGEVGILRVAQVISSCARNQGNVE